MVNYVPKIMKVMHQFKPEGQRLLLKTLRQNRGVINIRYGFAKELPSIIAKNGVVEKLDKACINNSIGSILEDLVVDGLKINIKSKAWGKTCAWYAAEKERIINNFRPMIEDLSVEFEKKRHEISDFFRAHGLEKMAKSAKNSQTPEQLAQIISQTPKMYAQNQSLIISNLLLKNRVRDFTFVEDLSEKELEELCRRVEKYIRERQKNPAIGYSLEALQQAHKENGKVGDFLLGLQKIISPKSTNPEIIKIENILREKYGMDYVHFDRLEDAKIFLEAARIASREGIPMAKNVSTSKFLWDGFAGFNTFDSNGNNLILLKSRQDNKLMSEEIAKLQTRAKNKKFKKYLSMSEEVNTQFGCTEQNLLSTSSKLHAPMHEIIHSEAIGKRFNPQLYKKIPDAQREVAGKVSNYAAVSIDGITEEVRTELRTKEILSKYQPRFAEKLTADEVKLLDYLS